MKKASSNTATASAPAEAMEPATTPGNGHATAVAEPTAADLSAILAGLQSMQQGDFSIRLPGSWTGLAGKIADTFNDIIAANEHMARELKRVGQVVGKEGRTRERTRFRT